MPLRDPTHKVLPVDVARSKAKLKPLQNIFKDSLPAKDRSNRTIKRKRIIMLELQSKRKLLQKILKLSSDFRKQEAQDNYVKVGKQMNKKVVKPIQKA